MPSGIQKYEMKLTDRLFTLKEEIAKRESVSADRVTMFCNDNAIHTEDTVKGLGKSREMYKAAVTCERFLVLVRLLRVALFLSNSFTLSYRNATPNNIITYE